MIRQSRSKLSAALVTLVRLAAVAALGLAAGACGSPPGAPADAASSDASPPPLIDAAIPDAEGPRNDPFAALLQLPAACSTDQWCWRRPQPTGNDYAHVYSTSHDNIWLIGQHGTVLQWNGVSWRPHTPPQPPGQTTAQLAYSISGRGPNDMWLLIGATIQHWNGTEWKIRDSLPPNGIIAFNNIWAAPNGDVWVTMNTGQVNRSIGGGPFQRLSTGCGCYLGNIWGFASNDFWITTLPGNILHYDGQSFTQTYTGTSPVGSLSGTGPDDVWVTGAEGAMLHWNGATWTRVAVPHSDGYIEAAATLASDDMWWWAMTNSSARSALLHWNGTHVESISIDTSALGGFLFDGALIDGRWWLVGARGAVYTLDPEQHTLSAVVDPEAMALKDMWGSADDNMYYAAANSIRHWNGTAITRISVAANAISGVRTNGVDELFATGFEVTPDNARYVALAWHHDGTSWTKTPLDQAPLAEHRYFTRVLALAPGEALAVGYGGLAYRFANGTWTPVASGVTADLLAMYAPDPDHVWIAGARGTLLRWDRADPGVMTPDPSLSTDLDLTSIHGAGGTTWIATAVSSVFRNAGQGWTQMPAGIAGGTIYALDATTVVLSAPGQGLLARWNGTAWAIEDNAAGMPTPVLFRPPGGPLIAGGLSSLVQHP